VKPVSSDRAVTPGRSPRSRQRIVAWALLVMATVAGLPACGGATPSRPPAAGSHAPAPSGAGGGPAQASVPPQTLTFSYSAPSAAFAPLWVAYEGGFLKKFGIDAKLERINSTAETAAFKQGSIDVDVDTAAINVMASGGQQKFVAELLTHPVFDVYGDAKLRSISGLRGSVVATTAPGGAPDVALRGLLLKNGLVPGKDVRLAVVNGEIAELAALKAGTVNAIVVDAPTTLLAAQAGFTDLGSSQTAGIGGLDSQLAVQTRLIQQEPDLVKRMLQAFEAAVQFAKGHKQQTEAVLSKYTGVKDQAELDATYDQYAPYWEVEPMRPSDIQAQLRHSPNPAARNADVQSLYDNSLIDALQGAKPSAGGTGASGGGR
jgi:ABC-type nitrate/sulfonate/bicarbonate transport system substrate-binding protein